MGVLGFVKFDDPLQAGLAMALVSLAILLSYAVPLVRFRLAQLKQLGELDKEPDGFFAKHRKDKPYLDVKMPFEIIPSQTYLFSYDLVREFYHLNKTLDYEMIKRDMDVVLFGLPEDFRSKPSTLKAGKAIEHNMHKRMALSNLHELFTPFTHYGLQEITNLKKKVEADNRLDLHSDLYDLMVRTATPAVFGPLLDLRGLPEELKAFDAEFGAQALIAQLRPGAHHLGKRLFGGPGHRAWEALVDRCRNYVQADGLKEASLMIMETIEWVEAENWEVDDIARSIALMLWALATNASDATGLVLSHILQSPALLQKIRREVDSLPTRSDGQLDMTPNSVLESLPHLGSAIHEVLRLRTTVVSARRAKEDIVISTNEHQVFVAKNRLVLAPCRALHTDPAVWQDPFTFDGSRFVGQEGQERLASLHWYGGGISKCAGKTFAQTEILFTIASLFRAFNFDEHSMRLTRDGVPIEGESFQIRDLDGIKHKGRWLGQHKTWRSNNAAIMRTYGSCEVSIALRS